MNGTVGKHTGRKAFGRATRLEEWNRRYMEELRDRKKDRAADQADEDFLDAATSLILATEAQIVEFRADLDRYDAATVETLMENQRQLDAVEASIDGMLLQAHVLPDGRRVFKTEDGKLVFDEHGHEVSPDIVTPDTISDGRPEWEPFKASVDLRDRLTAERRDLLDYQKKLDAARERIDDDEPLSADDLDDLKAELEMDMPAPVRVTLEGERQELEGPSAQLAAPESTPDPPPGLAGPG